MSVASTISQHEEEIQQHADNIKILQDTVSSCDSMLSKDRAFHLHDQDIQQIRNIRNIAVEKLEKSRLAHSFLMNIQEKKRLQLDDLVKYTLSKCQAGIIETLVMLAPLGSEHEHVKYLVGMNQDITDKISCIAASGLTAS